MITSYETWTLTGNDLAFEIVSHFNLESDRLEWLRFFNFIKDWLTSVEYIRSGDFFSVTLTTTSGYKVTGFTKRDKRDKWNYAEAKKTALRRALAVMKEQLG